MGNDADIAWFADRVLADRRQFLQKRSEVIRDRGKMAGPCAVAPPLARGTPLEGEVGPATFRGANQVRMTLEAWSPLGPWATSKLTSSP